MRSSLILYGTETDKFMGRDGTLEINSRESRLLLHPPTDPEEARAYWRELADTALMLADKLLIRSKS